MKKGKRHSDKQSKRKAARPIYVLLLKLSNHEEKTSSRGCHAAAGRRVTGLAAYDKSSMSELMNANVEALTRNETGKKECFNTITSDPAHQVRYCPTCDFVPGTDTWYAPADKC